jgi:hypothetical protein
MNAMSIGWSGVGVSVGSGVSVGTTVGVCVGRGVAVVAGAGVIVAVSVSVGAGETGGGAVRTALHDVSARTTAIRRIAMTGKIRPGALDSRLVKSGSLLVEQASSTLLRPWPASEVDQPTYHHRVSTPAAIGTAGSRTRRKSTEPFTIAWTWILADHGSWLTTGQPW